MRSSATHTIKQPFVHHQHTKPLLRRCIIPFIISIAFLYIILLFFVGNFNIWSVFTPSTNDSHSIHQSPSPKIHDTLLNTKNINNFKYDINRDYKYIHIMEHLHNNILSELSPELQSRKLQQLFRYKFSELLFQSLKKSSKNKQSPPSDYEIAKLISGIYAQHHSKVNFIQVGACDGDWGKSNDPIQKLLLRSLHWHGVMMEPVPNLFAKLKLSVMQSIPNHKQRIYLLNAALSDVDSIQTFFIVNEQFRKEMPHESHALKYQIGSFNKQHIIKHLKIKKERGQLSMELDDYISGIDVQSMTPMTVVEKFKVSEIAARDGIIDVLLIDAEGYDLVILQSFMKIPDIRPSLIVYENLHISGEEKKMAVELLNSYGYITINAGWNTFGVRVAEI